MLIYVNGDSFTAGVELQDYVIPGWPGAVSSDFDSSKIYAEWSKIQYKWRENYGFREFIEEEKKHAWPARLKKFNNNISIINSSVGGSSIAAIIYRTVKDLEEIKLQNKQVDCVFIQLTSAKRVEFVRLNEPYYIKSSTIFDAINTTDKNDILLKEISKDMLTHYTDEHWCIKYIYDLLILKNCVHGLSGVYPIFLTSVASEDSLRFIQETSKESLQVMEMSKLLQLNVDPQNKPMHFFANGQKLPGGHYTANTHEIYAMEIYNNYIQGLI